MLIRREYRVTRTRPDSEWYYGQVRFWYRKFWVTRRTRWESLGSGTDRAIVEAIIDKYDADQPDTYSYTPKAKGPGG